MQGLPAKCVDLVITDPPFALDFKASKANYHRKEERVLDGYSDIAPENYGEFTLAWLSEATRLLKDTGSMYIFSDGIA